MVTVTCGARPLPPPTCPSSRLLVRVLPLRHPIPLNHQNTVTCITPLEWPQHMNIPPTNIQRTIPLPNMHTPAHRSLRCAEQPPLPPLLHHLRLYIHTITLRLIPVQHSNPVLSPLRQPIRTMAKHLNTPYKHLLKLQHPNNNSGQKSHGPRPNHSLLTLHNLCLWQVGVRLQQVLRLIRGRTCHNNTLRLLSLVVFVRTTEEGTRMNQPNQKEKSVNASSQ